eukprot:1162053-Pelagomonas_calceolata.AAC.6
MLHTGGACAIARATCTWLDTVKDNACARPWQTLHMRGNACARLWQTLLMRGNASHHRVWQGCAQAKTCGRATLVGPALRHPRTYCTT